MFSPLDITEQMKHSMLYRKRSEQEYAPLYKKYGYNKKVSPLNSGLLTGKYNKGIPEGSRFATLSEGRAEFLASEEGLAKIKIKELNRIAESLDSTPTALVLAWLVKNPNTFTIILGMTSTVQLLQSLEALKLLPKITDEHMAQIEKILDNKPEDFPT
ncbi:NADP-dependent oxidoreductase domain-containing protein [Mycena vulgaris]|nr:NADP-dependent oxidoreductase domain-containing protein [Mycena vulgaris]